MAPPETGRAREAEESVNRTTEQKAERESESEGEIQLQAIRHSQGFHMIEWCLVAIISSWRRSPSAVSWRSIVRGFRCRAQADLRNGARRRERSRREPPLREAVLQPRLQDGAVGFQPSTGGASSPVGRADYRYVESNGSGQRRDCNWDSNAGVAYDRLQAKQLGGGWGRVRAMVGLCPWSRGTRPRFTKGGHLARRDRLAPAP